MVVVPEAYIWHWQYDDREYAENGKRAALDTVAYLEQQGWISEKDLSLLFMKEKIGFFS